jgi:cytoskeleton protein RodZ
VFEIGNSLREARIRQGIDLTRAEEATKIRARYLQALEDERFEILPAETYVKGFLRTYAEYLRLDGQLYVDEFNSRFASTDEPAASTVVPRRQRQRTSESSLVVVTLAGIVAIAVLVVVAFRFSNDDRTREPAANLGGPAATTAGGGSAGQGKGERAGGKRGGSRKGAGSATAAKVVLTAARGDCWVAVRSGGPEGELVFSGTIAYGSTERFAGRRLWLEFGAAPSQNLNVKLNGKRVRNFPVGEPVVIVTPNGVRAQD